MADCPNCGLDTAVYPHTPGTAKNSTPCDKAWIRSLRLAVSTLINTIDGKGLLNAEQALTGINNQWPNAGTFRQRYNEACEKLGVTIQLVDENLDEKKSGGQTTQQVRKTTQKSMPPPTQDQIKDAVSQLRLRSQEQITPVGPSLSPLQTDPTEDEQEEQTG